MQMDKMNERQLLFLWGPPFVGKSIHCQSLLNGDISGIKISTSQWLSKNPGLGLRAAVIHVTSLLKQSENVFLDDHSTAALRKSFIDFIRRKLSIACRFSCICCLPICGLTQLLWAREYRRAELFLENDMCSCCSLTIDDGFLDSWKLNDTMTRTDYPSKREGIDIEIKRLPLVFHSYYKPDKPALIIQLEALLQLDIKKMISILRTWIDANSVGWIILVAAYSQGTNYTLRSVKQKPVISEIISKLTVPLFQISLDEPLGKTTFLQPPQSGLIAILHRLFHIDLQHKSSQVICVSPDYMKCALGAGMSYVKAERLSKYPQLITQHGCNKTELPQHLISMKTNWNRHEKPLYAVPLSSCPTDDEEILHVLKNIGHGISLELHCKDRETLQSSCDKHLKFSTPITEDGSRVDCNIDAQMPLSTFEEKIEIPKLPEKDIKLPANTSPLSNRILPVWINSSPTRYRRNLNRTMNFTKEYILSPKELQEVAQQILKETSMKQIRKDISIDEPLSSNSKSREAERLTTKRRITVNSNDSGTNLYTKKLVQNNIEESELEVASVSSHNITTDGEKYTAADLSFLDTIF